MLTALYCPGCDHDRPCNDFAHDRRTVSGFARLCLTCAPPRLSTCDVCHAEFDYTYAGQAPARCSDECRKESARRRRREGYRSGRYAKPAPVGPWTGTRTCRYCERDFEAKGARAAVCYDDACQRRKHADRGRAFQRRYSAEHGVTYAHHRYPEQRRAATMQRKALVRGASSGEPISPAAIFARDGWTCALCDKPISPDLAFPDPLSASVDHAIPVSLGGAHSPDNVQAAHLGCNARKGNRTDTP